MNCRSSFSQMNKKKTNLYILSLTYSPFPFSILSYDSLGKIPRISSTSLEFAQNDFVSIIQQFFITKSQHISFRLMSTIP